MRFNIYALKYFLLPCVLYVVVALLAIIAIQDRNWLLPILFLLLPFVDAQWRMPRVFRGRASLISWLTTSVIISVLLYQNTQLINLFTMMLLLAALPEEWFFRAYLQKRLGNSITAILVVSLMFTLMHFITSNSFVSLLVFIPSVFFGWVYKKTDDMVLVVMLHALSNLLFYIYLKSQIVMFFGG